MHGIIPDQLERKTSVIGQYFNLLNNVRVVDHILKLFLSCLHLSGMENFPPLSYPLPRVIFCALFSALPGL